MTVAGVGPRLGASSLLVVPAIWVTTELGRTHLFGGFPWVLLGYSQVHVLPVAQLSSLFGLYGVSWLVAMISTALAQSLLVRGPEADARAGHGFGHPDRSRGMGRLACDAAHADGGQQPEHPRGTGPGEYRATRQARSHAAPIDSGTYLTLSREATAGGARLVIWPEAATPFPFGRERQQRRGRA